MFEYAINFNKELCWNTSNVKNMVNMFHGASKFTQELKWNKSNVKDLSFIIK